MTTSLQAPPASKATDSGGVRARRAVMRWAWRLFRRDWRSQLLVIALLGVSVASAIGGVTTAFNLAPAPGNAVLGTADNSLLFDEPDPGALDEDITAALAWFGTVDVIGRQFVPIPGVFEPVELRGQDPNGAFTTPMLNLVEGDYPVTGDEIALTDDVGMSLDAGIGSEVDLGGVTWTVVGLVENPSDLSDEFALVPLGSIHWQLDSVTILVDGTEERTQSFRPPSGANPTASGRSGNEDLLTALGVLLASTVLLVLVSMIAAAGFVVVFQRRLRQLGMLGAIGAKDRHLRLAMVSNGALVGISAAIIGAVIGIGVWALLVPGLETAAGHRIDSMNLPWPLITAGLVLAVVTATSAAWWPARALSRTPIVSALSGRPPRLSRPRRSAVMSGPLLVVGLGSLFLAGDPRDGWLNVILILVGAVSYIVALLLLSPLAIGVLSRAGRWPSVATRLAVRDLARYRARSGAALAAITLSLGMAATLIVTSSSALYTSGAEGNLADTQLLVRIGEIPSGGDVAPILERDPAELEQLDSAIVGIAQSLDRATVMPVEVAILPEFEGFEGVPAVVLAEKIEEGLFRILTFLYVASPDLLAHYDLDPETPGPGTEILTVERGELWLQPESDELVEAPHRLTPGYTSLPGSFITTEAMESRGWEAARAGWIIEAATPISDDQRAEAVSLAAAVGVTVEARDEQADLRALRTGATLTGMLVAVGILALTIGLIRSETSGDLRILTATGATAAIRRRLTGATAGALSALGAVLGIGGAYLGIIAVSTADLGSLLPVPVLHLLLLGVGVPLVAAGAGWLLGGAEPSVLARNPIE